MRNLLAFALLLLLPHAAQAEPNWFHRHRRMLLVEAAAVAGASIHAYGLHHCRRTNGVEPCDAHYGEAWASYGIATGMNVLVMPAVASACWKDDLGHFCDAFAWAPPIAQGAWGIHEFKIKKKAEK